MGFILSSLAAVVSGSVGIVLVVGAVVSAGRTAPERTVAVGCGGLFAIALAVLAVRKMHRVERVRKEEVDAARNEDGVVVPVAVAGWECSRCQSRGIDRTPSTGAPVSVYRCRACGTRQVTFSARVGMAAAGVLFALLVAFAAWKAVDEFGTGNGRRAVAGAAVLSPLAYFCFSIAALPAVRKAREAEPSE